MALHDHISPEELAALEEQIAAEDAQAEADPEVPESARTVAGHNAFADQGVSPRELSETNHDSE